jgi:hypothetical protein
LAIHVRGAAGYFLLAEGTRAETVRVAEAIQGRVAAEVGPLPFLLLLNKADLTGKWDLGHPPGGVLEASASRTPTSAGPTRCFRSSNRAYH